MCIGLYYINRKYILCINSYFYFVNMSFNNSDTENHNFENKNNDENDFYHSVLVRCIVAMTFTSYKEKKSNRIFFPHKIQVFYACFE